MNRRPDRPIWDPFFFEVENEVRKKTFPQDKVQKKWPNKWDFWLLRAHRIRRSPMTSAHPGQCGSGPVGGVATIPTSMFKFHFSWYPLQLYPSNFTPPTLLLQLFSNFFQTFFFLAHNVRFENMTFTTLPTGFYTRFPLLTMRGYFPY